MQKKFYSDRIASMPTSIFSLISKMAIEYDAVNLGQGFPDFDGPEFVKNAIKNALDSSKTQYAPTHGILSLRKAIAEYQKNYYDNKWNPETEITVTTGATEALHNAITAFIDPGDEVIMFEPYYDAYQADVILAGGIPRYITLNKPDFSFNKEKLEESINENTKMLILNSPHNPTGKIYEKEELVFIAKLAIKHKFLVLSDEAYEFLTFEKNHIPISTLEGMRKRTISVYSAGKTFGMTGLKVGYICADESITTAIGKVHQWTTFAVNTPSQHGVAAGFKELNNYIPQFQKLYRAKRDLMLHYLKETPFKAFLPYGTYFMMIEIPEGVFKNDIDASTRLTQEYKVATIPPSVFYSISDEGETMLRLCFAKQDETIKTGIANLKMQE